MPNTNTNSRPFFARAIDGVIGFCLQGKLVVFILAAAAVVAAVLVAPFDWKLGNLPRYPVGVDAIPDIGENQQIVFTDWPGRSPQDVEDQISYPLTAALLGIPKVKTIRSFSMFGFSSIYIIFEESAEFYWSRSRVLEKLASLPEGALPEGVSPALGPDATALGQIFWYTLEGRDPETGKPAGGWDPQTLRSIQDYTVRYALQSVSGVSEVASIGGYVKEYQIDVDPDAMRAYGVTLDSIFKAVKDSNIDVGARTIEINRVEYTIRGLGFIQDLEDLRNTAVTSRDNVPVTLRQIAAVQLGPALRQGVLDKAGAEAVGGVVVARYRANPMAVLEGVHEQIRRISDALPQRTLEDGTVSKIEIVPFYDRSGLVRETLGTLNRALEEEILVTMIVVLVIVLHFRSSVMISALLPLAVLFTFIAMKIFGVDANIVALSGIAIAIGTIVDMGIVVSENILRKLEDPALEGVDTAQRIFIATSEVGSAVFTAVLTTVAGFLPVFFLEGEEGRLFRPLAFTKTFALIASIVIALAILPPLAHLMLRPAGRRHWIVWLRVATAITGLLLPLLFPSIPWWAGAVIFAVAAEGLARDRLARHLQQPITVLFSIGAALVVAWILASSWLPLGPQRGLANQLFVVVLLGSFLLACLGFIRVYPVLLGGVLRAKAVIPLLLLAVTLSGAVIWLGFGRIFSFVPQSWKSTPLWSAVWHAFPGLGKEFMPALDEGSFLLMPTTMPHASIGEVLEVLQMQDRAIRNIPEVEEVVGKAGRVESSLDPAPVSMIETVISYKPEYRVNAQGDRLRFRYDADSEQFQRDAAGQLVPDPKGRPYREWRDHIRSPDDIWREILSVSEVPGVTSAPKLQPIETRLVMLRTGMRAAMGLKILGPDLETIESVGLQIESLLKQVPAIQPESVFADRIVGKPYLEIAIDRTAIARYGISVRAAQDVIEVAIGGRPLTTTVEGRERYPVRIRYLRERRDSIEDLAKILVPTPEGLQIPLGDLAEIRYLRGPQMIKSENTILTGYVIFDKRPNVPEVDVVQQADSFLREKLTKGELDLQGTHYAFTGSYENQVRAEARLAVIIPVALLIIFLLIYLQFRSVLTTLFVFTGVFVAWSGGFILLWLYGQHWFLDVTIASLNLRDLFHVQPVNLSVAVWVGFLALFGIATDDGVLMSTYLKQRFETDRPATLPAIRRTVLKAATLRNRPAMMTTITTLLALLPVLSSTGRGADIMIPMAIPTFGGMLMAVLTVFIVPTLYCWAEEIRLRWSKAFESLPASDAASTS